MFRESHEKCTFMAVLVRHSLFFFRVLAYFDASFLGFGSYLALNGSYTTIIFTSYHSAYMYISNLCGLLALEGKSASRSRLDTRGNAQSHF